jgi:hypothetical protein
MQNEDVCFMLEGFQVLNYCIPIVNILFEHSVETSQCSSNLGRLYIVAWKTFILRWFIVLTTLSFINYIYRAIDSFSDPYSEHSQDEDHLKLLLTFYLYLYFIYLFCYTAYGKSDSRCWEAKATTRAPESQLFAVVDCLCSRW